MHLPQLLTLLPQIVDTCVQLFRQDRDLPILLYEVLLKQFHRRTQIYDQLSFMRFMCSEVVVLLAKHRVIFFRLLHNHSDILSPADRFAEDSDWI